MTSSKERAAIYVRISRDKTGEATGVARQESMCRELAERHGLDVVNLYTDNDISAMSRKPRPAYQQMLADARAGRFDTIVVYATDRLYRRAADLEALIEDLGKVRVLAVQSGDIDLSTADGRGHARLLSTVAQMEAEKLSERVAARNKQRAESGVSATSSRPFGWQRLDSGLAPDPVEGPAVVEAYDRLLAGHSLSSIARWLDAEGFVGSKGGRWTQSNVSALLRLPRHAGFVVNKGEVLAGVTSTEGRLVEVSTWRQAQRLLTAPGRRKRGRDTVTHLRGLICCYKGSDAVCGGGMRPSSNSSRAGERYKTYACVKNHVSWRRGELEAIIDGAVVAYLEVNLEALRQAAAQAAAQTIDQESADALEEALAKREELLAGIESGAADLDTAQMMLQAVTKRIRTLEEAVEASTPTASATANLVAAGDLEAAWRDADTVAKHAALSELVERIVVHPKRDGRIEIVWR